MGREKEEVADAYFPVLPMREGGAVVGLQCGRGYSLDLLQPHLTESCQTRSQKKHCEQLQ